MILLVAGAEDYDNRGDLWKALDTVRSKRPISLVVHADRGTVDPPTGRTVCGAEKLAGVWAEARGIPAKTYTPDCILGDGQPEGAVAFPGADPDLCTRAEALGIKVWRPYG
jgi:hypothetical protein